MVLCILVTHYLVNSSPTNRYDCENSIDCTLKNEIKITKTPMMIGLSFSGIITSQTIKFINKIAKPRYRNPNGCSIQTTFFVSDSACNEQTEYCLVQELFNNNNEIGIGLK